MQFKKTKKIKGFTLVEILIVIAIISILAIIAIPSYQNYVLRANRVDAVNTLLDIANKQQQYFLDTRSYGTASNLGLTQGSCDANKAISENENYCITITTTATGYTLTATPIGAQLSDTECTSIAYNSAGEKTSQGSASASVCWGG